MVTRAEMGCLPSMEFEGPMGFFWNVTEVPIESLTKGMAEIWREFLRREYSETFILAMLNRELKNEQSRED